MQNESNSIRLKNTFIHISKRGHSHAVPNLYDFGSKNKIVTHAGLERPDDFFIQLFL